MIEGIKEKVIGIIAELFAQENVDRDLLEYVNLVDDLGMDSLTFISIVVEVESVFGIEVPDEVLLMEEWQTVEKIVGIIEKEVQSKTDEEG